MQSINSLRPIKRTGRAFRIFFSLLVLTTITFSSACNLLPGAKNGNSSSNSPSTTSGSAPGAGNSDGQSFSATVDGKQFSGKNIRATTTTIGGKPFVNLVAFSHDLNYAGAYKDEQIGMNIEGELKKGDHSFAGNPASPAAGSHGVYNAGSPDNDRPMEASFSIIDGQVSITSYDEKSKVASGTFSFSAKNKDGKVVRVTDGTFSNIAF